MVQGAVHQLISLAEVSEWKPKRCGWQQTHNLLLACKPQITSALDWHQMNCTLSDRRSGVQNGSATMLRLRHSSVNHHALHPCQVSIGVPCFRQIDIPISEPGNS